MASRQNLHLLTGPKRGLGVAYARGLSYALDQLRADVVIQMDADFSHNPADVPRLVEALEGHDLVIASRYIPGGAVPSDWGLVRRLVSICANAGARFIAGLRGVHDCTNGFRCIRARLLQRIDLRQSYPHGYAILLYLLYQAIANGGRVVEVPVRFANRTSGASKLRLTDALEFFVNVWWIRYDRRARFLRFASVGASGIAANLGALALLHHLLGFPAVAASALAIEVSILYSFFWNHLWAAAARQPAVPDALVRLARFNLVSVASFLLTFGTFLLLIGLTTLPPLAAQAIGILPALAWNYFVGERLLVPLQSWAGRSFGDALRAMRGRATEQPK
jgi:dolichol-phosphate mannosyltransferase